MPYKSISFDITTELVTWNDVAYMCFSKDSNKYHRLKKKQQAIIRHEIAQQIEIKNLFKDHPLNVTYDWYTPRPFDLGNLAAGEKFIADAINELNIWNDDRQLVSITHRKHKAHTSYVTVTITETRKEAPVLNEKPSDSPVKL